jgi:hypothetical protein
MMGDLTHNLSRAEFSCRCGCGFNTADFELVNALQDCCDYFSAVGRVRIQITGPNRCAAKNRDTPGAGDSSQHIYGRGVDFKIFVRTHDDGWEQLRPALVVRFFDDHYSHFGIGQYDNRTHVDSRSGGPARWDMRT